MKDEILNGTFYEWDIEYCDLMGDIDDHHHEIKLKDLKRTAQIHNPVWIVMECGVG